MMTAAAPAFALHGEITPALISALARLLISHAQREIAQERAAQGRADGDGEEER